MPETRTSRTQRLNGRVPHGDGRRCEAEGCAEPGEFKAPRHPHAEGAGPPSWRWFCLDHVRAFNAAYNFFEGMSADEIGRAQAGNPHWDRATRAFASNGYADRLAFEDNLEMIRLRFGQRAWEDAKARVRTPAGVPVSPADAKALTALGLSAAVSAADIRRRYTELVRRFHPDRNGGDRAHEGRLSAVIEAYNHLKASPAFRPAPDQEPTN